MSALGRPGLVLAAALAAIALVGVWWAGSTVLERRAQRLELESLRDELVALRAAASECQLEMAREEADFREHHERVDSLRAEVRGYEMLDERGVPGQRYGDYLDAFDRYNESVPEWRQRADSLSARWEACRDLAERHNAVADSARQRVEALSGGGP